MCIMLASISRVKVSGRDAAAQYRVAGTLLHRIVTNSAGRAIVERGVCLLTMDYSNSREIMESMKIYLEVAMTFIVRGGWVGTRGRESEAGMWSMAFVLGARTRQTKMVKQFVIT
jgi:hypothetical protein